jgi:hypothetical protein
MIDLLLTPSLTSPSLPSPTVPFTPCVGGWSDERQVDLKAQVTVRW